jgi:alcohol dehydrogenase (NADP+)
VLPELGAQVVKSKGAEVYVFTTSPSKREDILAFGAKRGKRFLGNCCRYFAFVQYDVAGYAAMVKPDGNSTQVGMPIGFRNN